MKNAIVPSYGMLLIQRPNQLLTFLVENIDDRAFLMKIQILYKENNGVLSDLG